METMTSYPLTPQTKTSHVRHSPSSRANPTIAVSATRSMQAPDVQHPPLSAPASQESFVSVYSNGSSVIPGLQTSSSNVSQITNYTDLASPASSASKRQHEQAQTTTKLQPRRERTPEAAVANGQVDAAYGLASPMSVDSPVSTHGAKRTASGQVKSVPSVPATPTTVACAGRRSRAESLSSTGSRAGELAASLKARLGYAMVKVQNGWEHKNLAEVEQLAAQKASPHRYSMSHVDYGKRPMSSGLSNGTARLSMYESPNPLTTDGTTSPPSKRHSGAYTSTSTAPRLQPPADIRPGTSSSRYQTAPSSRNNTHGHAMSPPRTPMNGQPRRPPTIRTDTQTAEAERDALQALFQLGSPHASQVSRHTNASQASSSQASPLRTEFATPRKVTFARSDSDSSARVSSIEDSPPA